jgi:CRISPR-associated Csx2 family protein
MAVTLISFLGRGPYAPDGKRKQYFRVQYQFDDWTSSKVAFFLHAALEWLRHNKTTGPDRLVVLGTPGSMWDELLLALCTGQQQRTEELALHLTDRVDAQAIARDDLDRLEKELTDVLGIEVRAGLVPPGQTQQEQAQILDTLQRHVDPDGRLILDVTHGYRHQPMLALGAAILLSRLRGVKIEEILYGGIELRPGDEPKPVVRLRWLLDLFDWADSIRQLHVGGRLRALTSVIRDGRLQKALADTAFFLATNQVHQAGLAAKECRQLLATAQADPLLDLTRDVIDTVLTDVAGCQRDAQGILEVARVALREQDYVRASILLVAALEKHEERPGVSLDSEPVREIRNLRNSLAHAFRHTDQVTRQALDSRQEMQRTLQKQLDWLETQINPREDQP